MHHHQEQQDGKTAFIVSLDGSIDSWQLANGGRLVLTADGKGRIVIVHVRAGPKEIRDVPVLSGTARFNDGNHTNVLPPPPLTGRADLNNCGVVLHGSSCAGFAVSPNVELVMNFGGDNGTADWNLTDLVLGYVPPYWKWAFCRTHENPRARSHGGQARRRAGAKAPGLRAFSYFLECWRLCLTTN
ncbi:MAG TPA: hypothetical protein VGF98_04085 [Candidatus Tumulicola sp.]|jgi:hypothetical protein